jgi:hypothetical protein
MVRAELHAVRPLPFKSMDWALCKHLACSEVRIDTTKYSESGSLWVHHMEQVSISLHPSFGHKTGR